MPPSRAWYQDWFDSPYYHLLYFRRDEQEARNFILRLLELLAPLPQARMLDLACGRGRHARILAGEGFEVMGLDLSPAAISYARQFETDKLHFAQHDMRLPFRINYFDYVFNLFTSFGYFETQREHYNAIRSMAQALKPGGTLILDYLNTHFAEDHLIHRSEKEIDGVNFFMTRWYDETHFYKKIQVEDQVLPEPLLFTEKVAKFTVGDFNEMMSFQHLQIQEVFGDYQLGPYDINKSPRLLIRAQKNSRR